MPKPSKPLKSYDLAKLLLIVGGYDISGFGEDGGVTLELGADRYEKTVGADGEVAVSANNDNTVIATINVMETSKAYRVLADLQRDQEDEEGALPALDFLMRDPINGDKVSDRYAVFMNKPAPSKGKKVGSREFRILLPNAAKGMTLGANNTI
jgi:hypothetical protein